MAAIAWKRISRPTSSRRSRRFWRTDDEDTYRIEVEDVRLGVVRRGYVRFDGRFWPFRRQQIVAEWDGT